MLPERSKRAPKSSKISMPDEKNSKKKIVFILPLLCAGGAERTIITLMNNLDREKFAPEMIVLDETGPLRDWIKEGIPVHSLGGVRVSRAFFKLKAALKELKPDVVVTTMAHSNFLLLLTRPFFPKAKYIVREAVVPSSILKDHPKISFILIALYKALYPLADAVLSPSQDIIEEFKKLGIRTGNHRVLYNQVDEAAIKNALEAPPLKLDQKNQALRLICVGRLHVQKGYDRLLEGLKQSPPSVDWELLVLGEGAERENLEKMIAEYGMENRVFLKGNQKNPWLYIARSDCLLLPSRWEGMPNVVLESLACGTPVIATKDANGVGEIKKHAQDGTVCIVNSIQDMIGLFPEIRKLDRSGHRKSLLPARFKLKKIMQEFEDIIA